MAIQFTEPADLAAIIQYQLVFEPTDIHVITSGFSEDPLAGFTIFESSPSASEELAHFAESAYHTTKGLTLEKRDANLVCIASYGDHGQARNHVTLKGLTPFLESLQEPPTVVQLHLDPQKNTFQTYLNQEERWTSPAPINEDAVNIYTGESPNLIAINAEQTKDQPEYTATRETRQSNFPPGRTSTETIWQPKAHARVQPGKENDTGQEQ